MKKDDLEAIFARVRTWTSDLQAEAFDALLAIEQELGAQARYPGKSALKAFRRGR